MAVTAVKERNAAVVLSPRLKKKGAVNKLSECRMGTGSLGRNFERAHPGDAKR